MKRRLLSLLLTMCMVLSLLPATALAAAGYDDNWYNYRQKWLYTVTANADTVNGPKKEENIRETKDNSGHGTTQTYDLGDVTFTPVGEEKQGYSGKYVDLTFTNVSNTIKDNYNSEGELGNPIYITFSKQSLKYVTAEWQNGADGRIEPGKTAVLRIAIRSDADAYIPAGKPTEEILFMEQESRVGWSVKFTMDVAPKTIDVTLDNGTIEKPYGKTLTAADITCTADGKKTTLEALGVGISGDCIASDAAVDSSCDIEIINKENSDFNVSITGKKQVKVVKATPVRTFISVGYGYAGNTLAQIGPPTATYVNPYTGAKVTGICTWTNPSESLTEEVQACQYTFEPTGEDGKNYNKVTETVYIDVGGSGSLATPGSDDPMLTANESDLTQIYDNAPKTVHFTKNGDGTVTVQYKLVKDSKEQDVQDTKWTTDAPKVAGTYAVLASVTASGKYKAVSVEKQMVIERQVIKPTIYIQARPYNGDTDATITNGNIILRTDVYLEKGDKTIEGDPSKDDYAAFFTARFDNPDVSKNKDVYVTVKDGVELAGSDADNYILQKEFTVSGEIFVKDITLALKSGVQKYYGQEMTFTAADYEVDALEANDTIDDLQVTLTSEGTKAGADVKSYSVSASAAKEGNYKINTGVSGSLKVVAATPQEISVSAGLGREKAYLSTVTSLAGTFSNPYNGEPVTGKLKWVNDKAIVPKAGTTESFQYVFEPTDKTRYTNVYGKADVMGTEKDPVEVNPGALSFVYTGDPCAVKPSSPETGTTFDVQYKADSGEWTANPFTDAGTYQVKITAKVPEGSPYGDNTIEDLQMVIRPATPTVSATMTKDGSGEKLSDYKLTASATGAKSASLSGTIKWDNEDQKVVQGQSYSWTWTPDEEITKNYNEVTGTEIPDPKPAPAPGVGGGGGAGGGGAAPEEPPAEEEQPPVEENTPALAPEAVADSAGGVKAEVKAEDMTAGVQSAKDSKQDSVVIAPKVEGSADKVAVEVPKSSVSDVAGAGLALKVETGLGSVTLPAGSLSKLAEQTGDKVSVAVASGKDSQVSIDVKVGSASVGQLDGGLSVSLPAKAGNVLVIVDGDGNETIVKKSLVDDGVVSALLDGSCTVKVVDNSTDFSDVADTAWYSSAVDFASSHELFKGVSDTSFAPGSTMTRGMLATVLWRLEDEAKSTSSAAFSDVGDTWYTDGVAWANEHGIVEGYGGSRFAPDNKVTREQLATMLYRYANWYGLDTSVQGNLNQFSDKGSVSNFAGTAMQWAVSKGLITGIDSKTLDPGGSATRAQVATILQRMVQLLVE